MNSLHKTDPEFMERLEYFMAEEVAREPGQHLDEPVRYMAVLAALIGCQAAELFREILPEALDNGLTPVKIKEIIYQSADYVGIGRMRPFLTAVNEVLEGRGVKLPLPGQATTTLEDRLEKGSLVQVDIFGGGMADFWKKGHINRWLAANCFGDYYTRKGLDLGEREMITFCFLAAQGGCEPQLTSHAAGNMGLGNDRDFLIRVVSQCLPYIGYPRSLNAIACINKAAEADNEKEMHTLKRSDEAAFSKENIFGKGEENTGFAQYFIGKSYLNPLTVPGESAVFLANVTFEPGCRNNWHIHHASKGGGQLLICTAGSGWYQEEGKDAVSLEPGMVITIPPEVKHWHGAKSDSWFSHIAVEVPGEDTENEWCGPVTDEAYNQLDFAKPASNKS